MKKISIIFGLLLAFLSIILTGCNGGTSAPQLGEPGKDTLVFIYTEG